jgi:hypothetical protein
MKKKEEEEEEKKKKKKGRGRSPKIIENVIVTPPNKYIMSFHLHFCKILFFVKYCFKKMGIPKPDNFKVLVPLNVCQHIYSMAELFGCVSLRDF